MEGEFGGDEFETREAGALCCSGLWIFDAVTCTSFFVFAFLGYEKSTCNNPAANLQALLGIVILMWTGNVTRPFRVAGAAALAPVIDRIEEDPEICQTSLPLSMHLLLWWVSWLLHVPRLLACLSFQDGESEMEISPADCVKLCSPPKS